MIIHEEYPIKIFTKKDNLYIYNFSKPFRSETTKIIIKNINSFVKMKKMMIIGNLLSIRLLNYQVIGKN